MSRIVMGRTSISLGNDLLQSGRVDDGATLVVLGSWDLSPACRLIARSPNFQKRPRAAPLP